MFDPETMLAAQATEGCQMSDEPQFHLGNESNNVVQSVGGWLYISTIPLLTGLFFFAGIQAVRTHRECSFDSNVLFLSGMYNIVFLLQNFIQCQLFMQYLGLLLVTMTILYLYFNFENVLQEMKAIENSRQSHLPQVSALTLFKENQQSEES